MHDANIRVAIAGAGGRMGRQLIQAALALEGVQLGAALEREGSSLLGSDAGELAGAGKTGVTVQSSLDAVKDDFDVFIDFTRPEGTLNHLAFCRQHGKGMVIGTTGLTKPVNRRFVTQPPILRLSLQPILALALTSCLNCWRKQPK